MAKQKLTAKQKRARKLAERAQNAKYKAGIIPAGKPQKKKKKAAGNVPRVSNAAKNAARNARRRSAADTAKLSKSQLAAEVAALWDAAYAKYRRLLQQGTPTAATVIYEQNFAGMNPYANTANTNRALAAKLKQWLKRKDISATKTKKAQKKTLKYLHEHGFPNITPADLSQFFDMYQKYLEYTGGVPQGVKKYLEHFASAYEKYKENPEENMQNIFENARERMYAEYESTFDAAIFSENPLEL